MPRSENAGNNPLPQAQLPGVEPQIANANREAAIAVHRARALVSRDWPSLLKTGETAIEIANARSFVFRFLSKAFALPTASSWEWLCNPMIQAAFCAALRQLTNEQETVVRESAKALMAQFHPGQFDPFLNDYLSVFGHTLSHSSGAADRKCGSTTESSSRAAELSSFFNAFGLELAPGCSQDQEQFSICLECISLLAAKEAVALERQPRGGPSARYHLAQQKFLSDFLGDYVSSFCRNLSGSVGTGLFARLCQFTQSFVQSECQRQSLEATLESRAAELLRLRPAE